MNKNVIIVGAIAVGLYLMSQGKKSTMAVVKKKASQRPKRKYPHHHFTPKVKLRAVLAKKKTKYNKPKIKRVIAKKKASYNKPKIKKAIAKKKTTYKKHTPRVAIARKQQIKRMQGGRKRM